MQLRPRRFRAKDVQNFRTAALPPHPLSPFSPFYLSQFARGTPKESCFPSDRICSILIGQRRAPLLQRETVAMSEYQYYEFAAIDGPISDEGLRYARGCSSRANVSRVR